ncbi:MAG: hypothetical protein QXO75_11930 [Nitrososphaerota archaeon]
MKKLGWDPENPDLVLLENKTSKGFTDYTLTDPARKGKKIMVIEAKKLSSGLDEFMPQLGNYCYSEGTKYGLLTNGTIFVLIKSFEEGLPIEERIIWKVDLEADPMQTVLRNLNLLDRENIGKLEETVHKLNDLYKAWSILRETPDVLAKAISPVLNQIASRESSFVYSDEEICSFVKEKLEEFPCSEEDSGGEAARGEDLKRPQDSGKYTRMYLGSEKFDITAANQILINTAEWLIRKGKINDKLLPIPAGPKRYLLNKENKNKYGGPLPSARKLSNGYWIMLNLNKESCIAYAKRLLVRFSVDPEILKLE